VRKSDDDLCHGTITPPKRRLGAINKQGNSFMRTLLAQSTQTVTRLDEGFRKQYLHRCHRMAKGVAKMAAARRYQFIRCS